MCVSVCVGLIPLLSSLMASIRLWFTTHTHTSVCYSAPGKKDPKTAIYLLSAACLRSYRDRERDKVTLSENVAEQIISLQQKTFVKVKVCQSWGVCVLDALN